MLKNTCKQPLLIQMLTFTDQNLVRQNILHKQIHLTDYDLLRVCVKFKVHLKVTGIKFVELAYGKSFNIFDIKKPQNIIT